MGGPAHMSGGKIRRQAQFESVGAGNIRFPLSLSVFGGGLGPGTSTRRRSILKHVDASQLVNDVDQMRLRIY